MPNHSSDNEQKPNKTGSKNSNALTSESPLPRKSGNSIARPTTRLPWSPGPDTKLFTSGNSRTQQQFKAECDINRIVSRFTDTGLITHLAKREGSYGIASAQTFTEAQFTVAAATSEFATLPSEIRKEFDNDPVKFLDAAQDPEQRDYFIKLGLIDADLPIIEPEPSQALSPAEPTTPEAKIDPD